MAKRLGGAPTPRRLALAAVVAHALGACEGGTPDEAAPVTWTVDAVPSVSIGGADDRPDYLVYGVVFATRLSDGRIVVAAQRSSQVKYFDADGTHLRTAGRAGDGPGEYRGIIDAARSPSDTVMVLSRSPGLSWLSPEGDFARSHRIDWSLGTPPCRIAEFNRRALPDGTVVSIFGDNFGIAGCPSTPPSPWRESALLLRHDFANGRTDTLAVLPGDERNSPNYRVFGRTLALAFGPDRFYASDTGSGQILGIGYDGDTVAVLDTPFPAHTVPAGAKGFERRRFLVPGGQERIGNPYLYPEAYPRLGRLLVDEVGHLWAMAYPELDEPVISPQLATIYGFFVEEGGARWRVMDPSGRIVAEVRTPPGLFPLEIGRDYVLGVSKDDYDVEAVELHRLTRRAG